MIFSPCHSSCQSFLFKENPIMDFIKLFWNPFSAFVKYCYFFIFPAMQQSLSPSSNPIPSIHWNHLNILFPVPLNMAAFLISFSVKYSFFPRYQIPSYYMKPSWNLLSFLIENCIFLPISLLYNTYFHLLSVLLRKCDQPSGNIYLPLTRKMAFFLFSTAT